MNSKRKLLVLAINELVKRELVSLSSTGATARDENDHGSVEVMLAGHTTRIQWTDIGHEELRVSVWWKYDHSKHPQAESEGHSRENFRTSAPLAKRQHYPKFVGVCVSGWIERKDGTFLQGNGSGSIFDVYVRRGEKEHLDQLPDVEPAGYAAERKSPR